MFCGKCGTKIKEGDSFCTNCGAKINLETPKKMTEVNNEKIEIQSITSRFIKYWEDKYPGRNFDSSYDEFSEFAKEGYKKEIEKVINSPLDDDTKIKKVYSIFNMVELDESNGLELQEKKRAKEKDTNTNEIFIPEYLGWIYDDASIQIEDALHKIYEDYYKNNKIVCDKIINEIKVEKEKYENGDTDWQEENILNYKRAEFDFVRLALNYLKNKDYPLVQVLSSFYKSGNNIDYKVLKKIK